MLDIPLPQKAEFLGLSFGSAFVLIGLFAWIADRLI